MNGKGGQERRFQGIELPTLINQSCNFKGTTFTSNNYKSSTYAQYNNIKG